MASWPTFVAASLALSPTAPPIGPGETPSDSAGQLAFDDADNPASTSTTGPGLAPNAGGPADPEAASDAGRLPQVPLRPPPPAPIRAQPPRLAARTQKQRAFQSHDPLRPNRLQSTSLRRSHQRSLRRTPHRSRGDWAYNWGFDPGVRTRLENLQPQTSVDAATFGVVADDGKDDHAGITAALASLGTSGGRVVLPAGSIQTSDTINLSTGQVLRGAGLYDTTIIFTADLTHGIELGGGYPSDGGTVVSSSDDGLQLVVRSSSPAVAGQLAVVLGGSGPSGQGRSDRFHPVGRTQWQ